MAQCNSNSKKDFNSENINNIFKRIYILSDVQMEIRNRIFKLDLLEFEEFFKVNSTPDVSAELERQLIVSVLNRRFNKKYDSKKIMEPRRLFRSYTTPEKSMDPEEHQERITPTEVEVLFTMSAKG